MREDMTMGDFESWLRQHMMMMEAQASTALSQDPTIQTCTVDDEGSMTMDAISDEDLKKEAERRTEEERKEWDERTK